MISPISPEFGLVILLEVLFGIGFNPLVHWAQGKKLWHVSISVVIGVLATIAIPLALGLINLYEAIVLVTAFTGSGIPMIVGSMRHTVIKASHKARKLGNSSAAIRDDAVLEINVILETLVRKAKDNRLTAGDIAEVVHKMHQVIGSLRSM